MKSWKRTLPVHLDHVYSCVCCGSSIFSSIVYNIRAFYSYKDGRLIDTCKAVIRSVSLSCTVPIHFYMFARIDIVS